MRMPVRTLLRQGRKRQPEEKPVVDVLVMLTTLALFSTAVLYVLACDRLKGDRP